MSATIVLIESESRTFEDGAGRKIRVRDCIVRTDRPPGLAGIKIEDLPHALTMAELRKIANFDEDDPDPDEIGTLTADYKSFREGAVVMKYGSKTHVFEVTAVDDQKV